MQLFLSPALLLSLFGPGFPQDRAISPEPVRLLVGFTSRGDERRCELLEQLRDALRTGDAVEPVVEALRECGEGRPAAFVDWLSRGGGRVVRRYWIANAAMIEVPATAADAVAAQPDVRCVEQSSLLSAHIKASTSSINHNADFVQVALNLRGEGTTLALLDSGVNLDYQGTGEPHPAFADPNHPGEDRVVHSQGIADPLAVSDENGHGTAVAGIALAVRWDSSTLSDDGFAPGADLASYRITRNGSLDTTPGDLMAAWEKVLADRAALNISVANCSYRGSPDPTSPAQQALDTLCYVGDVLVVTSAGNDGRLTSPTAFSQANVNGLAVGAVESGTHRIADFSSYGPPVGDGNRFFPDLVAVGVEVQSVPREALGVESRTGTSFAAPMVAGTALLVRQARSDFDFVDTKAVILNNLQDISDANPNLGRQHYGLGLLRSDLAVQAALNSDTLRGALVAGTEQRRDFLVQVVAGQDYSATLVWARTQTDTRDWDDLDLLVLDDRGSLVAGSGSPRNVYERVRFRAAKTAAYTLVVRSGYMSTPRAEFSLAFGPNLGGGVERGHYGAAGEACPGTGPDPAAGLVLPASARGQFGNARTRVPFAWSPTRLQQAFDGSAFPTSFTLRSVAFRRDQDQGTSPGLQMDLELWLGYTDKPIGALSTSFDDNPVAGTMVKVFEGGAFDLPGIAGAPAGADQFDYVLPLSQPFTVDAAGRNLLAEIRVNSHSAGSEPVFNWFDAVEGPGLRRVYTAGDPTGSSGIPDSVNLVVSFMGGGPAAAQPRLTWEGVPQLGDTFSLVLRDAPPGAVAVLLHGRSIVSWGTTPLPVDLGPLGAPGCLLRVEPFHALPLLVGPGGQARAEFSVPDLPALTGATFFNQFGVLDPQANPLGVVLTGAGFGLVGR